MLGEHRVRDGLRILRERVRAGAGRPVAPAGRCDWVPTAGRSRSLAPAQRHDPGPSGDHRSRPVVAREKRLERGLQTLASVLGDGPERGGVRPPVDENRLHGVGHLRARHRRHAADREVAGGRMHFAATDFRNRRHLFFFFFGASRASFAFPARELLLQLLGSQTVPQTAHPIRRKNARDSENECTKMIQQRTRCIQETKGRSESTSAIGAPLYAFVFGSRESRAAIAERSARPITHTEVAHPFRFTRAPRLLPRRAR